MLAGSGSPFHGSWGACRDPLPPARFTWRPRLSDPGLGVPQPVAPSFRLADLAAVGEPAEGGPGEPLRSAAPRPAIERPLGRAPAGRPPPGAAAAPPPTPPP